MNVKVLLQVESSERVMFIKSPSHLNKFSKWHILGSFFFFLVAVMLFLGSVISFVKVKM